MKISNFKRTQPKVVGTGLVALDVLLEDRYRSSDSALGGSTGNVLAILAFLGWTSVPVARLGRDAAATRIRDEFLSLHADTRFLKEEETTSTPVVYQWPGFGEKTHRFSFSCPVCGVKRSFVPSNDTAHCKHVLAGVDSPDVFYFDRVTPWALLLAEEFKQRGALVMFEPSSVDGDGPTFQRAIKASHILKYADERIDRLEAFDRSNLDLEIQTAGADGLRFRRPALRDELWHWLDALKVVTVEDTAGAGDWCTAGLLHYLCEKKGQDASSMPTLARALRYGQTLAALNCMYPGARGLARLLDEGLIKKYLKKLLSEDLISIPETPDYSMFEGAFHDFSGQGSLNSRVSRTDTKAFSTLLCCNSFSH